MYTTSNDYQLLYNYLLVGAQVPGFIKEDFNPESVLVILKKIENHIILGLLKFEISNTDSFLSFKELCQELNLEFITPNIELNKNEFVLLSEASPNDSSSIEVITNKGEFLKAHFEFDIWVFEKSNQVNKDFKILAWRYL